MARGRKSLVEEAAVRFRQGDDEGFVERFHERARLFTEPEISLEPRAEGRAGLRAWCAGAHQRLGGSVVHLCNVAEHEGGVIADLLVMPDETGGGGGWRVAIAFTFEDDLISEARSFWQRDAALESLQAHA